MLPLGIGHLGCSYVTNGNSGDKNYPREDESMGTKCESTIVTRSKQSVYCLRLDPKRRKGRDDFRRNFTQECYLYP